MSTLYVLVGKSGTRKSATIRALTGFTKGYDPWLVAVADSDEPRRIFIISASPQEQEKDTFKRHLDAIRASNKDCDVLLALHPDDRAPQYICQIQEINKRGIRWGLLGTTLEELLPELRSSLPGDPDLEEKDPKKLAANRIASLIRPKWRWL